MSTLTSKHVASALKSQQHRSAACSGHVNHSAQSETPPEAKKTLTIVLQQCSIGQQAARGAVNQQLWSTHPSFQSPWVHVAGSATGSGRWSQCTWLYNKACPAPGANADAQRQGQLGHQCAHLLSLNKATAHPSQTASSPAQDLVQQVTMVHSPVLQLAHLCTPNAGASQSVQQAPRECSKLPERPLAPGCFPAPAHSRNLTSARAGRRCTPTSTWLRTPSACIDETHPLNAVTHSGGRAHRAPGRADCMGHLSSSQRITRAALQHTAQFRNLTCAGLSAGRGRWHWRTSPYFS